MTVHGAKGLEFDTVILPDLSFTVRPPEIYAVDTPHPAPLPASGERVAEGRVRGATGSIVMRGQFETLSAWRDAGGRTLRDVGKAREEAELHRLFYVAVTRAKNEVVFVCGDGRSGFAKCVQELFGPIEFPSEAGREIRTLQVGEAEVRAAVERVAPRQTTARQRRRLADAALEAELSAAPPVGVVVPVPPPVAETRTAAEIHIARNRGRNRAAGIALHRFLERWDGVAPAESLLAAIAREQDVDEPTLRARVESLRTSPTFRRIQAAETLGREVPIRFLLDGEPVERRIDRWIREGERDVVVDYKSGDPVERDLEQVRAYCEALARITGRATGGLLWYIEQDRTMTV
jgi:ATP-dependent exoDNAse (exonuclease V) beta subunit